MAIHIADPETCKFVKQLANKLGLGITEAIKQSVRADLARLGVDPDAGTSKTEMIDPDLEKALYDRMYEIERSYLKIKKEGHAEKRGGSRVFAMLNRHGPVETLRRLLIRGENGPTLGFQILIAKGRIEETFEKAAIDPQFAAIIPDDIKQQAMKNLSQ